MNIHEGYGLEMIIIVSKMHSNEAILFSYK